MRSVSRERILFLTGSLAERRLQRTLEAMKAEDLDWEVRSVGVKVAALMTTDIIRRRLKSFEGATRVLLPGRSRVNLAALSAEFGVSFERGPDDLKDLPQYFGRAGGPPDLSRHDMRIFAEIVEAPTLTLEEILERAAEYRTAGADVIDLGCLPDTPFPHLEDAVSELKRGGYEVSVDSGDPKELRRGQRAGVQFLLSLTEHTLSIAEEGSNAVPVLIPSEPGDLEVARSCNPGHAESWAAVFSRIPFSTRSISGLRRACCAMPSCGGDFRISKSSWESAISRS